MLLFKQQYMSEVRVAQLKRKLQMCLLVGDNVSEHDLRAHYEAFTTIVNDLRMCDPFASEQQYRHDFHASLPHCLVQYMGESWKQQGTIDAIYQMALNGIDRDSERQRLTRGRSRGDGSESVPTAAFQVRNQPRSSTDANVREVLCYHCGFRGHHTGACTLINDPQTNRGKEAWAKRNSTTGADWIYDKRYYVAYIKAKDNGKTWEEAIAAGQAACDRGGKSSGHRDRSQSRPRTGADGSASSSSSSSSSSQQPRRNRQRAPSVASDSDSDVEVTGAKEQ